MITYDEQRRMDYAVASLASARIEPGKCQAAYSRRGDGSEFKLECLRCSFVVIDSDVDKLCKAWNEHLVLE